MDKYEMILSHNRRFKAHLNCLNETRVNDGIKKGRTQWTQKKK